ncbi:hypothetical protein ACJX0J_025058, partial [Zea mays]
MSVKKAQLIVPVIQHIRTCRKKYMEDNKGKKYPMNEYITWIWHTYEHLCGEQQKAWQDNLEMKK